MPPNTIYVGRGSRFGNPWRVGMYLNFTAAEAVESYRRWINGDPCYRSAGKPPSIDDIRKELCGKNLSCWCADDHPCHADVLLEIANA